MAGDRKRATRDDLDIAILWLENNEGEADERLPCMRVAEFLKEEVERRTVSQIARQHKISRKGARRAIAKMRGAA